ncbi:PREDICTED: chromatin complexes subunit BAP18 isoform X2 [Papilio polytes]|uniref:chromatin complexes subunit BAP18 isoform X2 n=1 Tax=Papilio polytes TaxID=76194 RepID=UPI0006769A08|nr:PREDICTED: chromatin complexes subunit BAP18 isoform X2 [Papilio polytes]
MDNSAAKVGQIFTEAGAAFNKLADMAMLLHPLAESLPSVCPQTKTPVKRKATEERVLTSTTSGQVLNMLKTQDSEDSKALNRDIKVEHGLNVEEVVV